MADGMTNGDTGEEEEEFHDVEEEMEGGGPVKTEIVIETMESSQQEGRQTVSSPPPFPRFRGCEMKWPSRQIKFHLSPIQFEKSEGIIIR